ncbi:MAG: YecR family lipoprotein [Roseovarius sp.]|uniref:YecR family lipoprotein n=1 Tax=Roseovarius sp. TaxID=1486281 RepID=UPI0032ED8ACF
MKFVPVSVVAASLLAGCMAPTPVAMQAHGGSRSDGLLEMSTTYNPQIEDISWTASSREASNRCHAWGFSHALPMGDARQSCLATDSYYGTCNSMQATQRYQCAMR